MRLMYHIRKVLGSILAPFLVFARARGVISSHQAAVEVSVSLQQTDLELLHTREVEFPCSHS